MTTPLTPGRDELDEADLFLRIKAARQYDYEHRERGRSWGSVPESQVLRLLIGAGLPDVIAEQDRLGELLEKTSVAKCDAMDERDSLTERIAGLRVLLSMLAGRAEASGAITAAEADEYRKRGGLT